MFTKSTPLILSLCIACFSLFSCSTHKHIQEKKTQKDIQIDNIKALDDAFYKASLTNKQKIINYIISNAQSHKSIFIAIRAALFQQDFNKKQEIYNNKKLVNNKELPNQIHNNHKQPKPSQKRKSLQIQNQVQNQKLNSLKTITQKEHRKIVKNIRQQGLILFDFFRGFALYNDVSIPFYAHLDKWFLENPLIIIKQMGIEKQYKDFLQKRSLQGKRNTFYNKFPLEFIFESNIYDLILENFYNSKIPPLTAFWAVWLVGYKNDVSKIPFLVNILKNNNFPLHNVIHIIALWSLNKFYYSHFDGFKINFINNQNPYLQELAIINFPLHYKTIDNIFFNRLYDDVSSPHLKIALIWTLLKNKQYNTIFEWIIKSSNKKYSPLVTLYKIYSVKYINPQTIPSFVISSLYRDNKLLSNAAFNVIYDIGKPNIAQALFPILKLKTPSKLQIPTLKILAKWKVHDSIPHIKDLIKHFILEHKKIKANKNKTNKTIESKPTSSTKNNKNNISHLTIVSNAIKTLLHIGLFDLFFLDILFNDDYNQEQKIIAVNGIMELDNINKHKKTIFSSLKDFYSQYLTSEKPTYPYDKFPQFRNILTAFASKSDLDTIFTQTNPILIAEAIYTIPHFIKDFDQNFNFLFEILGETKSFKIQVAIIKIISKLKLQQGLKLFINILTSKQASNPLKVHALLALGKTKNNAPISLVISFLSSTDKKLRIAALKALVYINSMQPIKRLEKIYLRTRDHDEKLAIIFTITMINNMKSINNRFIEYIVSRAYARQKQNKEFLLAFIKSITTDDKEALRLVRFIIINTRTSDKTSVKRFLTKEKVKDKTDNENDS